jgi:hypothetical protein
VPERERNSITSLLPYFFAGLILGGLGVIGLFVILTSTLPTLGPRWLFFFFLSLAASGTALPIIALLHRRFPSHPTVEPGAILRQAIWVGIYGNLLAWLQLGRVLNLSLIVFLAIGFVVIEVILRLRERTQWTPGGGGNE